MPGSPALLARRSALALVLVLTMGEGRALADEPLYLGGDAALFAGAASATSTSASALWYNPARLSESAHHAVDLAASAYMIRFGGEREIRSDAPSLGTTSYASPSLQAVPTAAAYARELLGMTAALGLFVPNVVVADPRSVARAGEATRVAIDRSYELTEYYAGVGLGGRVTPRLSLGGAFFGYLGDASFTDIFVNPSARGGAAASTVTWDEQRYGVMASLGLAYAATDDLTLALTLRGPVGAVDASRQGTEVRTSTDGEVSVARVDRAPEARWLAPTKVTLGAAYDLGPKVRLSAELRVRGPLGRGRVSEPAMVDLRLGARAKLGGSAWLGGGLFTDRGAASHDAVTSRRLDFYGASLGVELGAPYQVVDDEGHPGALHVLTSLAVAYSVGLGALENLVVRPDGTGIEVAERTERTTAHQLVVLVATTLDYRPNPKGPRRTASSPLRARGGRVEGERRDEEEGAPRRDSEGQAVRGAREHGAAHE